uniref:Uncharacterized protein n=1 Tax=Passalora fulva TaxID=5499 RepID=A0A9Q8PLW9_PASFU
MYTYRPRAKCFYIIPTRHQFLNKQFNHNPKEKLPPIYYDITDAFLAKDHKGLLPYRLGVDYKIHIKPNSLQEPLYRKPYGLAKKENEAVKK